MGDNARRFTLDKAPDSSQTYSTILHLDNQLLSGTLFSGEEIRQDGA
jgi:hypothetical protein